LAVDKVLGLEILAQVLDKQHEDGQWGGPGGSRDVQVFLRKLSKEIEDSEDPSPLTTESLIQEFGFKPVEGGLPQDILLEVAGYELRTWPEMVDGSGERRMYLEKGRNTWALGPLRPRTKGQLRRLLSLLADIQASLEGEEGKG
jgi:hypothetical protein